MGVRAFFRAVQRAGTAGQRGLDHPVAAAVGKEAEFARGGPEDPYGGHAERRGDVHGAGIVGDENFQRADGFHKLRHGGFTGQVEAVFRAGQLFYGAVPGRFAGAAHQQHLAAVSRGQFPDKAGPFFRGPALGGPGGARVYAYLYVVLRRERGGGAGGAGQAGESGFQVLGQRRKQRQVALHVVEQPREGDLVRKQEAADA